MIVEFQREAVLPTSAADAWSVISNVELVARCLPGLEELTATGDASYRAVVSDRVGPFRVKLTADLAVTTLEDRRRMEARITATDRKTGTRMSGQLTGSIAADGDVRLVVDARADVLGPLATLGAGPIRRRIDEIFGSVMTCLVGAIQSRATGPTPTHG